MQTKEPTPTAAPTITPPLGTQSEAPDLRKLRELNRAVNGVNRVPQGCTAAEVWIAETKIIEVE